MSKEIIARQLGDLLTIFIASILSNIIFSGDLQFYDLIILSTSLFLLVSIIIIPIFNLKGIYTYARQLEKIKKFKKIINVTLISWLILFGTLFIFNLYFKLSFNFTDLIFSEISFTIFFAGIGFTLSRILAYTYVDNTYKRANNSVLANRVLVIGGAGYIGSSLVSQLLERGYKVRILDILLFGTDPIKKHLDNPNLEIIKGDFRKIDDLCLAVENCFCVVHLGGIVGDPACSVDEKLTIEINLTATKTIGQIAKSAGVQKFIFASSCSVYGAQDTLLDESSETKPLSLYANTKIASERILDKLSDDNFTPIFLRFGTVYGFSGRTRFDLVVNLLTANALRKKTMTVFGKDQIRPFVHVNDAAYSVICAIKSKLSNSSSSHVFNVGSNAQNSSLHKLAKLIQVNLPDSEIIIEKEGHDARNYNVSFNKIESGLGFTAKWTLDEGIKQVINKMRDREIDDYTLSKYSNLKHLHEEGLKVLTEEESIRWEEMLLDETYE